MDVETHIKAFEERKETILQWAMKVRGIQQSQRIIGDNASRAIVELLSAYLHKRKIVEDGFQLNHAWFKSDKVAARLPDFSAKQEIIVKMIALEKACENLSYGTEKPLEKIEETVTLFKELEERIQEMLQ